ncbi:rhodanese-related sulfurtransferase [bacterium]|nr:rhodanese-related sulfurtransferase [bacterium]
MLWGCRRPVMALGMHTVLLFYKYVTVIEPQKYADVLRIKAEELRLAGRILVAEEGLNGTVEGLTEHAEAFAQFLLSDSRFADMQIKRSLGNGKAFRTMKVKVRNEIVGTRFPKEVDPRVRTGKHVQPSVVRSWFETGDDFTIIDMRNSYEFASGRFKGSIDPGIQNSRDLPEKMAQLHPYKHKKVLTVCTGGVRCEKMSAFLLEQGFSDVYQLDGGMHSYMEQYPGEDFEGTLYTFDNRVVMNFGGNRTIVGKCSYCGAHTERYVNCKSDACKAHYVACEQCAAYDRARNCVQCEAKTVSV